jgi:hypothetical protein
VVKGVDCVIHLAHPVNIGLHQIPGFQLIKMVI